MNKIKDVEIAPLSEYEIGAFKQMKKAHLKRYKILKNGALAEKENVNYEELCELLDFRNEIKKKNINYEDLPKIIEYWEMMRKEAKKFMNN